MKSLKSSAKMLAGKNNSGIFFLIVVLFLGLALGSYSNLKSNVVDNLSSSSFNSHNNSNGNNNNSNNPLACTRAAEIMNPQELLPNQTNNNFGGGNIENNNLKNVNLLRAGHHIGVNTVGSSLRNANLQVRSEPQNPRMKVCPWNQSTIEPDDTRRPLEIGCGSQ